MNIKPILLTVATLLATGCAGLETVSDSATRLVASGSEAVSNLRGDEFSGADAKQVELDVEGALANLRANGFREADFGSAAAMQSAALMVTSLEVEWGAFNDWNEKIYASLDDLKSRVAEKEEKAQQAFRVAPHGQRSGWSGLGLTAEQISFGREHMGPISCFAEDGSPRHYTDFADRSVIRTLTFSSSPDLAFEQWRRAEATTGKKLTWEEYQEYSVQEAMNAPLGRRYASRAEFLRQHHHRERAWRDYAERCLVFAPTVRGIYYTLNLHYGDVYGSLFAAIVDRVGAPQAHRIVESVLAQQVGKFNGLTAALWNYGNTGKWKPVYEVRPFSLTPIAGVMPSHLGAMCTPFGSSSAEQKQPRVDDIAAALGFQENGSRRGYHCLAWGDGNWEKLANLMERESILVRQFMASYDPIPSGYSVPSWAYPGPSQRDAVYSEHRANRQDIARGARAGTVVQTRTTCNYYAMRHSSLLNTLNLFKLNYPACDALDQLNEVFKERAEFSGIHAGRNDAYMCSSQAVDYSLYGNFDTSKCPRLYTFQELESGLHKLNEEDKQK